MSDLDPNADAATTDLVGFINGLNERRLAAYAVEPADILEHHGIEENVLAGGYGYRQLLELVQNGVDAMIEEITPEHAARTTGRIDVIIDQSTLYVANTGLPLSEGGINTLHSSHSSTKRGDQIGRFGLGFKSLLRLNGKIDLFSNSIAFRFDPNRCRQELQSIRPGDAPGLRLSWVLEVSSQISNDQRLAALWNWATTVIRAEINAPEVLKHLEEEMASFPAEFLLFLPMPVSLRLDNGLGLVRELHTTKEIDGTVLLHDGQQSTRWRVEQRDVRVTDESAKNDATHIHQRDAVPVAWALPLDSKREQTGRFWFCFPTNTQTRLPGILNAPWKLNSDRNAIIGGEWNKALMVAAAQLIVDTLPTLRTDDDPGKPLDNFPRQLERSDEIAAPLVTAVWESVVQTPIIPDATAQAELRSGSDLWRHPIEKPELAYEWAALASSEQRAKMVHPTCYLSGDRVSRLKALADRFNAQAPVPNQSPYLRSRNVADWFADIRSSDPTTSVKVLKLAEAYSNACQKQAWDTDRVRLAIIPSETGELMLPNQLCLSPTTENAPGLPLVAFHLSRDSEGRRLVTEVMKVRALDEQRWIQLLWQALNAIGTPRTADRPWCELWNKLRTAPTNVCDRFLAVNRDKVRVKRRDGHWVPPDEVLLTGMLGSEDDRYESNKLMLVDLDIHKDDGAMLAKIGVTSFPQERSLIGHQDIVLSENEAVLSEWLSECQSEYRARGDQRPRSYYLKALGLNMPRGWTLVTSLRGEANAKLTEALLKRLPDSEFAKPIEFGHSTTPDRYPKILVPPPLPWLICKHGHILIGKSTVKVSALVQHRNTPSISLIPDWDRLSPATEVLARAKPLISATLEDSQELWKALIEISATPEALADDTLHDLWSAAANSEVVPSTLRWKNGAVSLQEIFVSESPELALRARTSGRLAVTLDAKTLTKWIERGAQNLDHLLKPRFESTTPPAPLTTVFPELGIVLHENCHGDATCQSVSNLELCLDGYGESIPCLFWNDILLVDRNQLSSKPRSEMLKILLAELAGAGWLKLESQAAFKELWDGQVEDQRRKVRECAKLPERLFEAVGRNRERLLDILGDLRGKTFLDELTGEQLADVVLALFGTATLSKLHCALEANGLKPPGRWSSNEGRAFVESIGFGSEFAASSTAKRDAEEFISGPIKLPPLHDYQEEVYKGLREIISNGTGRRRGVVSLPTGGGKTRVVVQASVELILNLEGTNRTVLWVAQTDELCEQAVQAFRQVWVNLGPQSTDLRICRMWGGNPNPRTPEPDRPTVVIASIQTLSVRVGSPDLEWLNKTGMMIIDECHHAITKSYTNVLRWLSAEGKSQHEPEHEEPAIIGLSATPFRGADESETRWLANRFDNKLLPNDPGDLYKKLRSDRVLAEEQHEPLPLQTQLPSALRAKLEELANRIASDEDPEEITLLEEINQRLAVDEKRNDQLLDAVARRVAEDANTSILFFCNSVLHASEMAARLHLWRITAAAISGDTPSSARRSFLEHFKDGRIKVLCNHSVLTTGFDAPKTDMILIARQVFSRVRYMQMVGRGLRGPRNGGTEHCKIVTVDDNLGRFDNARHWDYLQTLWH
ncbi:DEAD/DEAH box helicase [Phragmitibacter flavus]|uniref:DEAD/DEAH box helicase n=1 Tax=Phragmitibacter flavus TaxID=2576071 RepID=A0A5R8KF99_9BACT|nr:DEAD/DEAH box helicase [Phragmitibacter flavus]TLD70976.1 DEAD/DEAH box helicase [Phragmitibacter flavus]